MHTSRALYWIAVVGSLLLAAAIAVRGINDLVLWADEGWTIYASDPDVSLADTVKRVEVDIHPPLFFVELHIWRAVTGSTIFGMRYFSALLMLVSVALLLRLGRDMFSAPAAIIAALLYASHDLIGVFVQEVRHYPQQQWLTLLVMWLYWRWWQRPTWTRMILFSLGAAALLWSHYWGGLLLAVLALHGIITRRSHKMMLVAGFGLAGLLFVPWLPALYEQVTNIEDQLRYMWDNSWTAYKILIAQLGGEPPGVWLLLVAAGTLTLTGARQYQPSYASALLAGIVFFIFWGTVLLNEFIDSLYVRSLALIVPAVVLLVAHGVAQFRQPERWIMVGVLLLLNWGTTAASPPGRANWDQVGEYVAQHSTDADLILLELDNHELKYLQELTFSFYLDDFSDKQARYVSTEGARVADPDGFQAYLDKQLTDEDHLYIVKLGWPYYDLRADLTWRGFVETAPLLTWDDFAGMPVELWRYDRQTITDQPPALRFGESLRLHHSSMHSQDEWVTVNLLWSPVTTPERNYSISVFLLNASGALVAQHDSYPLENNSPTLTWKAGGLYFDSHVLPVENLPAGTYSVGLRVYAFTDETFTTLEIEPPDPCVDNACEYAILSEVEVTG